jgi:hypothetical protein
MRSNPRLLPGAAPSGRRSSGLSTLSRYDAHTWICLLHAGKTVTVSALQSRAVYWNPSIRGMLQGIVQYQKGHKALT